MEEDSKQDQRLESRLNELKDLYISPRTLLISVTLLNVTLFIGGTVYTGLQVASIQQRYQEASQKIIDAKQKYDEAEAKTKQIQSIADGTKVILGEIQRQAGDLAADLQKKSKESGNEITNIKTQADQQLELLKKSGTSIVTSMTSYQRQTEAALEKAANDVGTKLEKEIQFNKDAINKKQASIDALGLQIEGFSAKVNQKELELSKIQHSFENQLDAAGKLNNEFTSKLKSIARTDKITLPVAYDITDVWVKALFCFLPIVSLLSLVLAFLLRKPKRYLPADKTIIS